MLVLSLVVSLIFHRFSWAFEFTQEGLREADDILNLQGFSQYYSDAPNHIFHGQENILQPGQYQSSFQYNTGAQDQPAITSYKQPVLPSTACHEAQISNQILHSQWLQHLAELRFHDGNHLVFDSYPEHSADHQFHQYLDVYADQPESIQLQSNWYPNQNHQNFKEHILEGNFEYLKTPFVWSEAPLDFFNEPHLPGSSLKAAGSTRRVNSEQEEDFINDVVRESDFSLLSQSAMILENGGRVGSRNFHGYLLSDPHCGSNNNKNSLISNLLPPQSDETNLFDSNYLLRCPHNTIYKSRNEDIESFNIKGDELAEQRVIPENLNNIKFTLETEATLKTPKLSNNLRLHLNVDSPGSLIGQNEDNVPKTIISNTSLDSNIPPLLTNVGHEEIKNLNGKEAAECSKSQTSGDIAILTKQNGTRNKLKDLGKENPKKRKRNPNNLTAEKKNPEPEKLF
ncbi:expressed protein [Phakopsora pachyrhizi]|uniref:Expressed protein n=1 Tax=Phakopsora pachyrhizi TaxID=170000 RepID=A0AAV0BU69_PHAPC|nr:expressed protein [Phakopsora pachyrhizi]